MELFLVTNPLLVYKIDSYQGGILIVLKDLAIYMFQYGKKLGYKIVILFHNNRKWCI